MNLSSDQNFERVSERHRQCLESRGYSEVVQTCLEGHVWGNSPWKTYWTAEQDELGEVFIKINYGYSQEVNQKIGLKEARLPKYLAGHFEHEPEIQFPDVLDHWEHDGEYFVVFSRVEFRDEPILSLAKAADRFATLFSRFMGTWISIKPPSWWNSSYEIHDFAMDRGFSDTTKKLAPFGFDLDENLGITLDGRLFIYDFEFLQWTRLGVQHLFLLGKLMSSGTQLFRSVSNEGLANDLFAQLATDITTEARIQAFAALAARYERKNQLGLSARLRIATAKFFVWIKS